MPQLALLAAGRRTWRRRLADAVSAAQSLKLQGNSPFAGPYLQMMPQGRIGLRSLAPACGPARALKRCNDFNLLAGSPIGRVPGYFFAQEMTRRGGAGPSSPLY